jgi:hypothetical protein
MGKRAKVGDKRKRKDGHYWEKLGNGKWKRLPKKKDDDESKAGAAAKKERELEKSPSYRKRMAAHELGPEPTKEEMAAAREEDRRWMEEADRKEREEKATEAEENRATLERWRSEGMTPEVEAERRRFFPSVFEGEADVKGWAERKGGKAKGGLRVVEGGKAPGGGAPAGPAEDPAKGHVWKDEKGERLDVLSVEDGKVRYSKRGMYDTKVAPVDEFKAKNKLASRERGVAGKGPPAEPGTREAHAQMASRRYERLEMKAKDPKEELRHAMRADIANNIAAGKGREAAIDAASTTLESRAKRGYEGAEELLKSQDIGELVDEVEADLRGRMTKEAPGPESPKGPKRRPMTEEEKKKAKREWAERARRMGKLD